MPGLISSAKYELTIAQFEEMTRHAAQVQESLLAAILEENAGCEYLQQFGVEKGRDGEFFRERVPLVTHADIQPFIQRIAEGERGAILTACPIEAMCLSSGTTEAKEKYLPFHEGLQNGTLEVAGVSAAFRARARGISERARVLEFLFCGKLGTTVGGLKVGTATTHMIRSNVFKQRQSNNGLQPCSPQQVVLGSDYRQVMYCHLLCGLLFSQEVEVVSAPFAYTLVEALRTFEAQWESLCEDLRTGTVSPLKVTDTTLRTRMGEILRPNPKLAESLYIKCKILAKRSCAWIGMVEALWPQCRYMLSIMTGTMEAYMMKLQHYAGKNVPLISADYAATEGWIGVNVEPLSMPLAVSFTVLPSLAFFEFIPLHPSEHLVGSSSTSTIMEESHSVRLTDVKVGQEYEIVMTTRWGLYRYCLGDIVRVTGFYNATPQLAYVCRKNVMLSINIDKNTEKDLKVVMSKAAKHLAEVSRNAMELVDYTSYADRREMPGHYAIFWEVDFIDGMQNTMSGPMHTNASTHLHLQGGICEKCLNQKQLQMWLVECATFMDRTFVEPGYVTSRKMNTIGALELCVVKQGTFSKLLDRFLSKGAAITQYKTPRCIISPDAHSILCENTSITIFSKATF